MALSRQLIPRFFGRDYWDVFDYPERVFGQDFGMSMEPFVNDPLFSDLDAYRRALRRQPLEAIQRAQGSLERSGSSSVKNDKDNFQVSLDVRHFKPNEVTVKYQDDGSVVVHGKHEERSDEHGYISREFTRRYALPGDIEQEKVACAWTPDGVLTINAPKKAKELPPPTNERNIPIAMSGEQKTNGQQVQKK